MHCGLVPRLSRKLSLVFLCLLAGCGESSRNAPPAVPAREGPPAQDAGRLAGKATPAADYPREAAALDRAIEHALRLIDRQTDDTLIALETVAVYIERARLTGNYDDYGKAAALLEVATARGDKASFPCLAHAKLHYALHRLQAATAALAACPATVDPVETAILSADIAFYSGRYKEAEETYRALVDQVGSPQAYIRLALLRNKTGAPGEAAALLEAA